MNHPGFIEDHEAAGWQMLWKVCKHIFRQAAVFHNQQFRLITLRNREKRDPRFGQRVIKPVDIQCFYLFQWLKLPVSKSTAILHFSFHCFVMPEKPT